MARHQLIEKQVIFEGRKSRLEVHQLREEESGKKIFREVVIHPGAVVVMGFVDARTIMLIRNRRYAVGQTLIELPAGTLEPGELPMNCAGRELLEETGYLAARIKPIGTYFTSPGILSEKMYAFTAYDLEQRKQSLDEGEEIELMPTKLSDAIEMILSGEIADGKTIATLLMYERFFANAK